MMKLCFSDDRDDTIKIILCNVISFHQIVNRTRAYGSVFLLVQSLNSPFFPPHTGTEPGRAKGETLFSPALVQPLYGAGRKESSGTGLSLSLNKRKRGDSHLEALIFMVPSETVFLELSLLFQKTPLENVTIVV